MKSLTILISVLFFSTTIMSQVGIGTSSPAPSAALHLNSNNKGLLIPRMTGAERIAISAPADGLMVYQTDTNIGVYIFKSGSWAILSAGVSNPKIIARTTNLILTTATYTNVVEIILEANKTYFIESMLLGQRVGASSGNGTFQLVYSGTASTDFGFFVNANTFADIIIDATPSFDLDAAALPSSFTTTPSNKYQLSGYLKTTTAGTLTIKGARAIGNTTVDLNVREGSYIMATPLD